MTEDEKTVTDAASVAYMGGHAEAPNTRTLRFVEMIKILRRDLDHPRENGFGLVAPYLIYRVDEALAIMETPQGKPKDFERNACTFCGVASGDLTTGTDGKTTACADCLGDAVDE
jgi:hypothetical protein